MNLIVKHTEQRVIMHYLVVLFTSVFIGSYILYNLSNEPTFSRVFYTAICLLIAVTAAVCMVSLNVAKTSKIHRFANMFLFTALMFGCCLQAYDINTSILFTNYTQTVVIDILMFVIFLSNGIWILDYAQLLFFVAELESKTHVQ